MVAGTDGYAVRRDYPAAYQAEMAPAHLRALMVLRRRRAADPNQPLRFLDLGCGSGFTCSLLAAVHPRSQFIGVDMEPGHIVQARDRAAAIGLTNTDFIEASFAEILEARDTLGSFEILSCHGVLAWVTLENRLRVAEIARRHLAPGGLAYFGYNAMPGWGQTAPLRHLIRRLADAQPALDAEAAIDTGRAILGELREAGVGAMRQNTPAARWLDKLADQPAAYLAHEFLPEAAEPLWHDTVSEMMAGANLTYVGAARLVENFDSLNQPEGVRERLAEADRAGWGEALRDLGCNQSFRMDVFARGAPTLHDAGAEAAFASLPFALTEPPPETPLVATAQGTRALSVGLCAPLLEHAASGPTTVAEAVDHATATGLDRKAARQALIGLLAGGLVTPLATLDPDPEAVSACQVFNSAAAHDRRRGQGHAWPARASPFFGGLPLSGPSQEALDTRADHPAAVHWRRLGLIPDFRDQNSIGPL